MTIGNLNRILSGITTRVTYIDSENLPPHAEGDGIRLKWGDVRDMGVALHVALPQVCFVDRVVVTLGEKTRLTQAELRAGTQVLSRYHAETGKVATQTIIELEAGAATDAVSLCLRCDFSDVEVLSVELYGAVEDNKPWLFPTPNEVEAGDNALPVSAFKTYSADDADGICAGELLADKFGEITGMCLFRVSGHADICFVTDTSVPADGYTLDIAEQGTTVRASNLRGMVCGAECFIKLTNERGVRVCRVSDSPRMAFRGVHLFIPAHEQLEFARRLVKYMLSPMGYNTVIMEVAAGMKFESHPDINEKTEDAIEKAKQGIWPAFPHSSVAEGKAVEKSEVAAFVDYIRSFGIDVIPEVQSLGHVPFMTHTYPEIAEVEEDDGREKIDTRLEDAKPDRFYPHCYCPSNERSYEILFDLLDEIIEVFRPREYVHMGHDEVYYIGVCPRCRDKHPADLFAADVNKIHDHLAAKGLKMMMWADMLQPVTKYRTPAAIDRIPKDIVLMDFIWYFHLDKDIEDNLLSHDFQVIFGNVYSSHFPRYESRIVKDGILGAQISAWVPTNEHALQKEGKLYDFLMTAQMFWSRDYSKALTLTYDRMIADMMPRLREKLKGIRYPSRTAGAKTRVLVENPITFPPALPVDQVSSFEVGEVYDSLILCHTALRKLTRMPWKPNDVVGRYVLRYEDGTTEVIPVENSGNIGYWNRRHDQPLLHPLYRHNGYTCCYDTDGEESRTADGEPVTVYRYEHILPAKRLISVTLEQDPAYDAQIFLCRAEGVIRG